jgi:parvulin-like peptidyl-prolyl isomerase
MIKHHKVVFKIIFFLSLINISIIQSQQLALPNKIIADVGTYKVSESDFKTRYSEYLFSTGSKDNIVTRRAILNNMINEIILKNYDDNASILSSDEFQREANWTKKQSLLAYLKDQEVFAKIKVTDKELRDAFYKSNMKISARHLYAQTEEEANNLFQLLQTGATFNTLAMQVFSDSTLRNNGGYLGFFSWGDMDPAFEDAAYSLKPGEFSKPIKTGNGFSIIRVEERVPNPIITEDQFLRNKKHMERVVRMRKMHSEEEKFIRKIFNPDKIIFNEKSVASVNEYLLYISNGNVEQRIPQKQNETCVKYGNKKHTESEIEKKILELPLYHRNKLTTVQNLKAAIKGIILQEVLLNLAFKKKYDKAPLVQNTISKYHDYLFLKYKRENIADAKSFTDSTVYKYYVNNLSSFKNENELNIQEIIIKKKTLADSLLVMLKSGVDFGQTAQRYSKREWSAKNDGEIGFAEVSKFGMLKDTLWKSSIGELIGPIKIEEMYGIFKILGKKDGEPKKFESVRKSAEQRLKAEKSREIVNEYVAEIRKKITIKYDDNALGLINMN